MRILFLLLIMTGCAGPIVQTQVVEKPVPVFCEVELPAECKDAYATDKVSPADNMLIINRAFRIELEERSACETKLRAALNGCSKKTL